MNDVPVVAAEGAGFATLELALAGLATGEYLLEISATAVAATPRSSSASGSRAERCG